MIRSGSFRNVRDIKTAPSVPVLPPISIPSLAESSAPASPRVHELIQMHSIFREKSNAEFFEKFSRIKKAILKDKSLQNIKIMVSQIDQLINDLSHKKDARLTRDLEPKYWYLKAICLFYIEVNDAESLAGKKAGALDAMLIAVYAGTNERGHRDALQSIKRYHKSYENYLDLEKEIKTKIAHQYDDRDWLRKTVCQQAVLNRLYNGFYPMYMAQARKLLTHAIGEDTSYIDSRFASPR